MIILKRLAKHIPEISILNILNETESICGTKL